MTRYFGRDAKKKILTLVALFIAAFILIFTGLRYSLVEESEPWDVLALLPIGCGILVLAVAVGLSVDWRREIGALTGGLNGLARLFGTICVILLILFGGAFVQIQSLQNQVSNLNSILVSGSLEVVAVSLNITLPETWVFAGSVEPGQIQINESARAFLVCCGRYVKFDSFRVV